MPLYDEVVGRKIIFFNLYLNKKGEKLTVGDRDGERRRRWKWWLQLSVGVDGGRINEATA